MQTHRQYVPKEFVVGASKTGYVRRRAVSQSLSLYTGDDENLTAEDRFLAQLLGRSLTHIDRMDYYWEEQPEPVKKESSQYHYFAESNPVVKSAVSGVAWLGREAMSMRSIFRSSSPLRPAYKRSHSCDDNEKEMNSPITRQAAGGLSDTMISVVAGLLIASFIVFPLLRKGGGAIYTSIFNSTVRKISEDVSVNLEGDASLLLPFFNRSSHDSSGHHSQPAENPPIHKE